MMVYVLLECVNDNKVLIIIHCVITCIINFSGLKKAPALLFWL